MKRLPARIDAVLIALHGVCLAPMPSQAQRHSPGAPAQPDPIGFLAHGAAFGPDGQHLEVTPALIATAQDRYLARLYEAANTWQRARYNEEALMLRSAAPLQSLVGLHAHAPLLDWMLEEVVHAESGQWPSRRARSSRAPARPAAAMAASQRRPTGCARC